MIAHTCVRWGRRKRALAGVSEVFSGLCLLWRRRFLNVVRVVPLWFSRLSACRSHHATTWKTSLLNPTCPFTMETSWALCWRLCRSRTRGEISQHEPNPTPDTCATWRDCTNYHPNRTGVTRPLTCTTLPAWSRLERSVSSKTEVYYFYLLYHEDLRDVICMRLL